jgi:epoxyqueuosine reductase
MQTTLEQKIKEKAFSLGFARVGICGESPQRDKEFYDWWTQQGFAADMHFLKQQRPRRQRLSEILPGAQAAVVCLMQFPGAPPEEFAPPAQNRTHGKIARYAIHEDYHNTIEPKLAELAKFIDEVAGAKSLAYIDTGAIPERSLAREAGLGWIGKNAMLIHPEDGSWFWIGEIITTAALSPDRPITDHCGKCRKCIDACPTGAILEDLRAVDSRKCLAYLNIEHRGEIASEFHKPMGEWLLGCDICQEVCPWNNHALKHGRKDLGPPATEWIAVDEILSLSQEEFKARYRTRAHSRAKYAGLQRNAGIVKRNLNDA